MFKSIMLSALGLLIYSGASQAEVVRLGSASVSNNSDRIIVNVPDTCGIARVQLVNRGQRTNIQAIFVDYRAKNATRTRFPINRVLARGEGTGWLTLPGNGARCVTRIIVAGRSLGGPAASRVDIYADVRAANTGGARLLGTARLSEGGTFNYVGIANACNLQQIRLRVTGDSARIDYLAVRFGNGSFQRIDVRANFAEGTSSAWKSLAGTEGRCLTAFFVVGRSSDRPQDARVQLIGR